MKNQDPIKILIYTGIGIVILSSIALYFQIKEFLDSRQPQAAAVGLRGTTRISKDLSNHQTEKLEKHLLETPPTGHVPNPSANVQAEVNTINQLNQRQRP